jgi:hypothetical protein
MAATRLFGPSGLFDSFAGWSLQLLLAVVVVEPLFPPTTIRAGRNDAPAGSLMDQDVLFLADR